MLALSSMPWWATIGNTMAALMSWIIAGAGVAIGAITAAISLENISNQAAKGKAWAVNRMAVFRENREAKKAEKAEATKAVLTAHQKVSEDGKSVKVDVNAWVEEKKKKTDEPAGAPA